MQDRPSAAELVRAVKEHFEREVLPVLENAKVRYQSLVALHVLSVVERELAHGERALREELASLRALSGGAAEEGATLKEIEDLVRRGTQALCAAIRSGQAGDPARVRAHVRGVVLAKLAIANPAYTSLLAPPPPKPA
jgi:hypothetical protein